MKKNYEYRSDRVGRLVRGGLRNRVQVVTQESFEDHNRDANERLEATQVSTMHEDVITLSDEVSIHMYLINITK